jgi:hypothetical protein
MSLDLLPCHWFVPSQQMCITGIFTGPGFGMTGIFFEIAWIILENQCHPANVLEWLFALSTLKMPLSSVSTFAWNKMGLKSHR